jgi:hypothetical protein
MSDRNPDGRSLIARNPWAVRRNFGKVEIAAPRFGVAPPSPRDFDDVIVIRSNY